MNTRHRAKKKKKKKRASLDIPDGHYCIYKHTTEIKNKRHACLMCFN